MEMTLLVEEYLVVEEAFLLVDLLDPLGLKDHQVYKDQKASMDQKPTTQGTPAPLGPQGPTSERPSDPNIAFNTKGLETSFADLGRSMLHLFDAKQVTNQHLHQQIKLKDMT